MAQSINDLNLKKNASESNDLNCLEKSPELNQIESIAEKNISIKMNLETTDHEIHKEINKIMIANEEISILAEHFSEPVVDTLFDVFNSSELKV